MHACMLVCQFVCMCVYVFVCLCMHIKSILKVLKDLLPKKLTTVLCAWRSKLCLEVSYQCLFERLISWQHMLRQTRHLY